MEQIRFEEALQELRQIVESLERGEKPLEEALALFERGIALVSFCARRLDEVEHRVEVLLRDQAGQLHTKPFEETSPSAG
ncbi:MAG: exodeoxyribonuclease VII small subunit [Thermodesulfobacteriota bacterium]